MKTYKIIGEYAETMQCDDGPWVPADVAQGLYEALEVVYTLGLDDTQERIVEKALAAADGEEV